MSDESAKTTDGEDQQEFKTEGNPFLEKLFPKTNGIVVPLELAKDFADMTKDNAKKTYWGLRVKLDDFVTYLKIRKNYKVSYVLDPKDGRTAVLSKKK